MRTLIASFALALAAARGALAGASDGARAQDRMFLRGGQPRDAGAESRRLNAGAIHIHAEVDVAPEDDVDDIANKAQNEDDLADKVTDDLTHTDGIDAVSTGEIHVHPESAEPTAAPEAPTPAPVPTAAPTGAPTPAPATPEPTAKATPEPTAATTPEPAEPEATPEPTAAPKTAEPTEAPPTEAPPTPAPPTDSPTPQPTAAPTPAPTPAPAAADEVHVHFTLKNVDYAAVQADSDTSAAVTQEVQKTVAEEAGGNYTADDVEVELSEGSLHVHAILRSPDGTDVSLVHEALSKSSTLGDKQARHISAIPGVANAATGEISLSEMTVERKPPGSGMGGQRSGPLPMWLLIAGGAAVGASLILCAIMMMRKGNDECRQVKTTDGAKVETNESQSPLMGQQDDSSFPHAFVVPGGGLDKDGKPPEWMLARLKKAKELYDAAMADKSRPSGRRNPYIVALSAGGASKTRVGPKRTDEPTEAEVNSLYLVRELGVPTADVLTETQSEDTLGNAFYLRTTHTDAGAMRNLTIITNRFHMPRTTAIFQKVFSLPPFALGLDNGYQLSFEEATDAGIAPEQLFKRCEKEAGSLEQFNKLCSRWSRMQDLHSFIYKSAAKRPTAQKAPSQPAVPEGETITPPQGSPMASARSNTGSYYRGKSSARSSYTTYSYVSGQAPDTYRSGQGDSLAEER